VINASQNISISECSPVGKLPNVECPSPNLWLLGREGFFSYNLPGGPTSLLATVRSGSVLSFSACPEVSP